jgi:hypothetical protein
MASPKRSLADRMMRWRALITNGKQKFPDEVPQAVPDLEELERVTAEVWRLSCEQKRLAADLRVTTQRAQELGRHADRLRGRIGAALRGQFGFTSTKLREFGFKPRKSRLGEPDLEDLEEEETEAAEALEAQEPPAAAPETPEAAN